VESNLADHDLRLRLRSDQFHSLNEMYRVGGCGLSFEEFCSQVIEAAVADFKLRKIVQDSRLLPPSPLITPQKKGRKKFDAEAVEKILALRDEGMKAPEIAERFRVHEMTIQRVLRQHY